MKNESGSLSTPVGESATTGSISQAELLAISKSKVGQVLDEWKLESLLGVGPTSASYVAVKKGAHATLRRMHSHLATSEQARTQFVRAAYAANGFHHPSALQIMSNGLDTEGVPFVLRGGYDAESLEGHLGITHGVLTDKYALRMAADILDVLEVAHAFGVAHGAVKPTNILLTSKGESVLCDFSIPSATESINDAPSESPAREEDVSADLYSLAACIYFAVTAKSPTVPLQANPTPGIGEYFAKVIDHALYSPAELRYNSAHAMLADIRRVMADRPPKLSGSLQSDHNDFDGAGSAHFRVAPSSMVMPLFMPGFDQTTNMGFGEVPLKSRSEKPPSNSANATDAQPETEWKGYAILAVSGLLVVLGIALFTTFFGGK